MTGPYDDLPEGQGAVPDPEEAAQDTVLRHVLDAVRGGDTPDVVPPTSSVAGFAEFLAVEAVLDKRWPETKIAADAGADRRPRRAARRPAARLSRGAPDRHERQDVHGADGGRPAQRDRAAHRPLHQPAPAERHRADQHRQPAGDPGALRRGVPGRGAVRRSGGRPPRHAVEQVRGAHGDGVRRVRGRAGRGGRRRGRAGRALGRHERRRRRGRGDHARSAWTTPSTSARTCSASRGRRPGSSSPVPWRCSPRRTRPSPRC